MNLHNDLMKVKIKHGCEQCCRKCGSCHEACVEFYPANMTAFMNDVVGTLLETVEKSSERTLKRHALRSRNVHDDGVTTLDEYYVLLVNTALAEIRRGKSDYVYSFEQIKDILRFEPEITVRYIPDAGAYEVRKVR